MLSEWTILISAYSAAPLMMLMDTGAEGRTTWHGNLALILAEQQPCRWKARKNLHTSKVAKSMGIELKLASKTLYISTAQDEKQVLQAKKMQLKLTKLHARFKKKWQKKPLHKKGENEPVSIAFTLHLDLLVLHQISFYTFLAALSIITTPFAKSWTVLVMGNVLCNII